MRTIGFFITVMLLWPLIQHQKIKESTNNPDGKKNTIFRFNLPVSGSPFLIPDTKKKNIDTNHLKQSSWYSNAIKQIEESEYEIKKIEKSNEFASPNRQQNLRASYSADKCTLEPRENDNWKLQLTLEGVYSGKKRIYSPAQDAIAVTEKNKIQFNHNNEFKVEYINSKEGVRQNFIIEKKPVRSSSKLSIQLTANKNWYINKVHDKELHFAKRENDQLSKKITYNSLKVWDANNKELSARFTVNEEHTAFEIEVNTVDALYPITIDPLSSSPSTTLNGLIAGAEFGYSVSSAGDVNGDGYSDVIIGAFWVSAWPGAAYIYHGSSTGLSTSPATTLTGPFNWSYFGCSVSSAGDVNGDGYGDVIVGAFQGGSYGAAYVYLGSNTGLATSPATTMNSVFVAENLGFSVSSAGDVNGDGYSDVIVGNISGTSIAYVRVYMGSSTGLSSSPAITLTGVPSDYFGRCVSSAGDVNGDGYSDVIVGAYGTSSNTGAAYVYLGSSTGLSSTASTTLNGVSAGDYFGLSLSDAGDINGDGYSDVIIGASGVSTFRGAAYIFLGSSTGLSASPSSTVNGVNAYDNFGYGVSSAGDVNGDGYSDVIFYGVSGSSAAAYVYSGSSAGLSGSPLIILPGIVSGDQFGTRVSSAGDVNGDGYSDLLVGAPGTSSNTGAAYSYHGSPDGLKTTSNWQTESDQANAYFGISVASAGDVNSDGYSDVLVGAYIYDEGFGDNGKAYLYMGSSSGLSTTASWTAAGVMSAEYFGRCVAAAGDVNGDGYGDVLIGGYGYTNGQFQEGKVYLYYGSSGGLSVSPGWSKESDVAAAVMGISVAGAGDINGDGYGDIIIGAAQYNNGEFDEGAAFMFYGSSTGPAAVADWTAEGNEVSAQFGVSVAGLGDVNGDGYSDIIIGSYLYDSGEADEGKAFAYYGSATGLPASPNWTAEGNQIDARFGICVAAAGDVNGDGFGDAIVGAYYYDDGTTDEGAAFVYHGSSSGLSPTANWTAENNIANTFFAYTVCSAGDVNGDGYSDVLIGARDYSNGQANEGALYAYYGSSTGLSVTNSWFVESNNAGIILGNCVAGAGDVNGDGFSDIIAGAPYYTNPSYREGAAFVYYGNNSSGLRNNLRLYNADLVTPIQQSNFYEANLFGAGLYAKSFLGRQKGRLVWETVKNGNPFSGTPSITNSTAYTAQTAVDSVIDLTGKELKHQIAKQLSAKATYIRARVKYDKVTAITGQVYGPWRYPEGFLRGRRDVGSVALPVKFISFTAVKQNNAALLKWITMDEEPGVQFEVQHSEDGINFSVLTVMNGKNQTRNEYEWLQVGPAKGNNFYRIRATENNKTVLTVTRLLNFSDPVVTNIYPNPVTPGHTVTIENNGIVQNERLSVLLFNMSGQSVLQKEMNATENGRMLINIPDLPSGAYLLQMKTRQWEYRVKIIVPGD